MAKSKCTNCYGKGYATVMESLSGGGDFIGDKVVQTAPKVYRRFCVCRKGQRLKREACDAGKKQVLFNLYEE